MCFGDKRFRFAGSRATVHKNNRDSPARGLRYTKTTERFARWLLCPRFVLSPLISSREYKVDSVKEKKAINKMQQKRLVSLCDDASRHVSR